MRPGGQLIRRQGEQRRQMLPKIPVREARGKELKQQQGGPERLHFRTGEPQRGGPPGAHFKGTVEWLEGFFGKDAVVADLLDFEETPVGLKARAA